MKRWSIGMALVFLATIDIVIFLTLLGCEVLMRTFK